MSSIPIPLPVSLADVPNRARPEPDPLEEMKHLESSDNDLLTKPLEELEPLPTVYRRAEDFTHSVILRLTGLTTQNWGDNRLEILEQVLLTLTIWKQEVVAATPIDFTSLLLDLSATRPSLDRSLRRVVSGIVSTEEQIIQELDNHENYESEPIRIYPLFRDVTQWCDHLNGLKPAVRSHVDALARQDRPLASAKTELAGLPPCILCLDGGGVRSYSSLLILERLLSYVAEQWEVQSPDSQKAPPSLPCEVFDHIYGSSSGGLLAIMLGRLEIPIDDCKERYDAYAKRIFQRPAFARGWRLWGAKYHEGKISQAMRRLVNEFDPTDRSDMWRRQAFSVPTSHKCKVGILATNISDGTCHMFRNYPQRPLLDAGENSTTRLQSSVASPLQIWEVARATSAAPAFFSAVSNDEGNFVDGSLTANNPTLEAFKEVQKLYEGIIPGTCIVSIGSGQLPAKRHSVLYRMQPQTIRRAREWVDILRKSATDTTRADAYMEAETSYSKIAYFRLNADFQRHIKIDEWSDRVRIEIETWTRNYLTDPVIEQYFRQCASAIVARLTSSPIKNAKRRVF